MPAGSKEFWGALGEHFGGPCVCVGGHWGGTGVDRGLGGGRPYLTGAGACGTLGWAGRGGQALHRACRGRHRHESRRMCVVREIGELQEWEFARTLYGHCQLGWMLSIGGARQDRRLYRTACQHAPRPHSERTGRSSRLSCSPLPCQPSSTNPHLCWFGWMGGRQCFNCLPCH